MALGINGTNVLSWNEYICISGYRMAYRDNVYSIENFTLLPWSQVEIVME